MVRGDPGLASGNARPHNCEAVQVNRFTTLWDMRIVTAETSNLVVIGGGVMGLFTAYHAAQRSARVVVLERGRIGDPMTASYGRTRSFRNDYLDPVYARLAPEAFPLRGEVARHTRPHAPR